MPIVKYLLCILYRSLSVDKCLLSKICCVLSILLTQMIDYTSGPHWLKSYLSFQGQMSRLGFELYPYLFKIPLILFIHLVHGLVLAVYPDLILL